MVGLIRFCLVWVVLLGHLPSGFGQALIVEFSDSHSAYERLPLFLRSLARLRREYEAREPNGKLILLVNGDFSGASPIAFDRGNLGYDVLAALAENWEFVVNVGNHEAFDWPGQEGQVLFLAQHERLRELVPSFRITTANVELARGARHLFQPHHEVVMASGERLRFHGFTLRRFFRVSSISRDAPTQTITGIAPVEESIRDGLSRALEEGVRTNIILLHDNREQLERFMASTMEWRDDRRRRATLNLPVAFAGHDHEAVRTRVANTLIVDSGSHFDFSTVELNSTGEVVGLPQFFNQVLQERFTNANGELSEGEARALELVQNYLEDTGHELQRGIARTGGFRATKQDLKAGPETLGIAIADAMAIWARETLANLVGIEMPLRWLPVVAFFNSSSYRRDDAIPEGIFTEGDLRSIHPMPNEGMGVFQVNGTQLIALYRSLREHRRKEQSYSPQLSSNLREQNSQLEYKDRNGVWVAVGPEHNFALVADPWLSRNGFDLSAWSRLLSRGTALVSPGQNTTRFIDAIRGTIARCEKFMLGDQG